MADIALIQLHENAFYLPGAVNVGVIKTPDGGALLVDSGSDKDHGKRILKACRAAGLEPRAIINTHSHADHYGGNAYLQAELGIPAYCPIFEEAILKYPILEPIYLYSGARPPKALQTKWLMAQASGAKILNEPGPKTICGVELELLETSGHAHMMFSVRSGAVLYASDAVFGPALLEKYPLQFAVDIARQREAVEAVERYARDFGVRTVLPGHGDPTQDVQGLCGANLKAIERATNAVLAACHEAGTLPEILERVCAMLEIEMTDLARYHLNQTAVLAHLTDMLEREVIEYRLVQNKLLWRARSSQASIND
jgi:glyoxylase-like metal-dependent hydrolase (beta-lactamase superfamily II)